MWEDYLVNFIFGNYSKELLAYLLPIGYLSFLLYFYRTKQWCHFSDFDKIAFTLLSCYMILNFLIVPMTVSISLLYYFFIFVDEAHLISPVQNVNVYNWSLLILITVLACLRLSYKAPLYESKEVQKFFLNFIAYTMIFLYCVSIYFGLLSKLSGYSHYCEYLQIHLIQSILQLFVFFIMYLLIHRNDTELQELIYLPYKNIINSLVGKVKKIAPSIEDSLIKVGLAFIFVILFLVLLVIGVFLFNPTIIERGQEVNEIYISELPVFNPPKYISAEKKLSKYYTVKSPIVLNWVKVTSNLDLERAYTKIDGKNNDYYINDDYFIVNECSKTNVTAIVTEKINLSTELIISDKVLPKYGTDIENFKITLKNNITGKIDIDYIDLYIDSNYEPIQLTMNYTFPTFQYLNTWTKNDENFNDYIIIKGNSLFLCFPELNQNESVEISVVFEKINQTK